MVNSDQSRQLKKQILDIEEAQIIKEEEQKWIERGLFPSGEASNAIGLIRVKYSKLRELIDQQIEIKDPAVMVENLPQEKYRYENKQLRFVLTSGEMDQFDFSKAEAARKMFEAFWYLWLSDGKGEYTKEQVRKSYLKLHEESIVEIGRTVSNIRASIINPKLVIRDNIEWRFDPDKFKWIFRIK